MTSPLLQSTMDLKSNSIETTVAATNPWKFDHEDESLDQQMCCLIDNLAVSPHLANQFCQLTIDAEEEEEAQAEEEDENSLMTTTQSNRLKVPQLSAIRGRTDSSDSGVGDCSEQYVIPTQQQIEAILTRLEAYFSDDHLRTDTFLLKHIRRSKEGFVSLKLVSSFQKMKSLTKDWRVVAHCIRHHSKALELNETGSKVRRIAALPEDILQLPITKKKSNRLSNNGSNASNLSNHSTLFDSIEFNFNSHNLNSSEASCTQLLEQLERRWPRILLAFEPTPTLNTPSVFMTALQAYCERFGPLIDLKLLRPGRALRLDAVRRTLVSQKVDLRRWRQLCALIEFSSVAQAQHVLQMQPQTNPRSQFTCTSQFFLCALQIRPIDQTRFEQPSLNSLLSDSLSNSSNTLFSPMSSLNRSSLGLESNGSLSRPRNQSDIGPIERIQFDSFDPLSSSSTFNISNSNSTLNSSSRLTLNDSFESFDSFNSMYTFGRPRASTISHFADWGNRSSSQSKQLNDNDWQIGSNRTVNPIGPIARPKSNSVSAQDQSNLMSNGSSVSPNNLLRLPKGPDAHAFGFLSGNRSRSTSSPSAMMQLFAFP